MNAVRLGALMVSRVGSVNPSRFPNEVFDLYSIPAFDIGESELVRGANIGSVKQIVAPGDVLLSKIVPHIRRAWVVGQSRGHRVIASGEWIIFRGPFDSSYLRHVLTGDVFHHQFMNTVAGVGGSLLRARPALVKDIAVPMPPIEEQRRIADVLDRADALRAKRHKALALLDELARSIFRDMFGSSLDGYPSVPLRETFWFQEGPGVRKWQFRDAGIKLLNVGNIRNDGTLDLSGTERYLDPEEVASKYSHFLVNEGDLVIASSGISFDADGLLSTRAAFVRENDLPLCMNTSTIRFKSAHGRGNLVYLKAWFDSSEFRQQITKLVTGSAQQNFGPTHLKVLNITMPPLELQQEFARRMTTVERQRASLLSAVAGHQALSASLQQRASAGLL